MTLAVSADYAQLAELADSCHRAGRRIEGITPTDIDRARLFSYGFRAHAIGTFHATRVALADVPAANPTAAAHRQRAVELLEILADRAMDPVSADAHAVLSSFHGYDREVRRVLDALRQELAAGGDDRLNTISARYQQAVEGVTTSNGIVLTRDTAAPEQASFVVPNLGITIVPLVYGDYHSWNLAWLSGERSDVPRHLHHDGVEIHLGYSPIHGHTILGNCAAAVREGYAMPIPPGTAHGYVNAGDGVHHVPFLFGSLKAGGWGVFLDVAPQPFQFAELRPVDLASAEMNQSVRLEREIATAASRPGLHRLVMIPAAVTDRSGTGGLELAITRVPPSGWEVPEGTFRIVSVVRGAGSVRINDVEQAIQAHDHFGIPAGMAAKLAQAGGDPLVVLDSVILG